MRREGVKIPVRGRVRNSTSQERVWVVGLRVVERLEQIP
jgi:hypothetical protein